MYTIPATMAPLSLKIVLDEGAVTRTLMFEGTAKIKDAHEIVKDKILTLDPNKDYGFFLTSMENDSAGVWLQENKTLEYYMIRDGDSLFYLPKLRNLKVRMLDGAVKTLQVDESQKIQDLMVVICEKIGTANYEEYGLCREETQAVEEATKSPMGTLTLKRKTREKDAQLQQMSKKLKTDDNVEWLDQRKTLRELRVEPKDTLLFKRRLFYSDRNIDSRDPVQLNLLYVQTRDAILDGRQVVTEDKAVEFAGIQCHIQYGDFQEKKHKPGFIENLKEFLPEQYAGSWGVEKKVIKVHQKLIGMSTVEAKHLYTKTARELPTYGVTFFLVKEQQKGKKKLVHRLLGINSESILRLDEGTKEILQTWLLTQVKSYTAGNESFTLNFGDYSDKSYVVKTNEAIRIKDILEGYIDIIRKKLAAPFNVTHVEGEVMCEDMVESSKGTVVQTVVPSKMVEHSLVGPSQIISVDQGQLSQQGTQIVTVQQVITSIRGDKSQQPVKGEVSMRSNIPQDFGKRLNHLNSECVKTVVLLSNPTMENLQQVRKIIDDLEDGMPGIIKGVKEVAGNQHGDSTQKLLEELDELCNYMNMLASTTRRSDLREPDNLMTAQDAAKKVAEISTQMCFSLDPKAKRRSTLLMRSRNSFIQDEKTEASLRRASFINAADNASQAVEEAQEELDQRYNGPILSDEELRRLETKSVDRMGKLNAAIALLLNAHADPRNIDYEMAVNSMKTINELMPEFVQDAKPLTGVGDSNSGRALREQIGHLLNRTGTICRLTGSHDIQAMQFEGDAYANVAKRLIYTFSRSYCKPGGNQMPDEENKITAQCKDIEEKANLLLSVTNELMSLEQNDPRTNELEAAEVKCNDAVRGLLACAKLTAPSIHEPHCQSALTAAVENLSSSAQNLILCSKPLVEKPNRHKIGHQLSDGSFNLAKALDKLKELYSNFNGTKAEEMDVSEEPNIQEANRLKFIATTASTRNALMDADKELQEIIKIPMTVEPRSRKRDPAVQRLLSQKLAQLNAAIAALLQASSDKENPDYDTAETAANTIQELTPDIIENIKSMQGTMDENSWNEITSTLEDMLKATRAICVNAEESNVQEMNNAASKFANSSGKLVYVFNPRKNPNKEKEIIDLSRTALQDTSQMLSNVYLLAETIGGKDGEDLDSAGVKVVDAAQLLLKTAEITAPSIADARCQATLLTSIDSLSDLTRTLESTWKPLVQSSDFCQIVDDLNRDLNLVQIGLKKLRRACQDNADEDDIITDEQTDEDKQQEIKRLKFIATKTAAKSALTDADKHLDEIMKKPTPKKSKDDVKNTDIEVQCRMSEKLAELNAAVAMFLQANSDRQNPDYDKADMAFNNICKLTPDIIKDTERLHGSVDDNLWKEIAEHLKSILDATQGMCSISQEADVQEMNDAATKFAKSSGKLIYIFNPRKNPKKEEQISDLSRSAVEQTSQMLSHVYQLAQSVGGEEGNKLDDAGVKVVDVAQQLLKTAEITAPSISDARCRETLLSAIERLSNHLRDLENTWMPLVDEPLHRAMGNQLNNDLNSVKMVLNNLRDACQEGSRVPATSEIGINEMQERKRLKFIATKTAVKNALTEADKQLDEVMRKPVSKKPKVNISATNPEVQRRISEKLAELNAAIATLVQASSDKNNPDYENAEIAINSICELTPNIIKDTEHLHGNSDDQSWKEIADNLRSMLDAIQGICSNSQEGDVKNMNDAASDFAKSSGKLTYIFNPRKNPKKEEQISDLSRSAVEQTSQMLSHVYQLAKSIGGEEGSKLDDVGVKVVDVAQQLLKTAEITAPSISDARCKETLLSAIERLSNHLRDLENTWMPLVDEPLHRAMGNQLNNDLNSVKMVLKNLRDACLEGFRNDIPAASQIGTNEMQERKRLKFIASKSAVKNALTEADKQLDAIIRKPVSKISKGISTTNPEVQRRVSEKLAELNAVIANLVQASSDNNNPDYENAEIAIHSICKLTPNIIKDTEHLHGNVDEKSWKEIADNLKSILDAIQGICFNSQEGDLKEMNDAASKFAESSGKLIYIFNPRKNPNKEKQISDLSRSTLEQTSQMLSRVYQLAESVGGEEANNLDDVGVKVVDVAQQLLKTAEITAPTISDARCKETLLSAIERLSSSLKNLENTWTPLVDEPKHRRIGNQLNHDLKSVKMVLNHLKDACLEEAGNDDPPASEIRGDEMQERKRLKFIATKSAAKHALIEADKQLEEIMKKPVSKKLKDNSNSTHLDVRRNLSEKLAELNAAIAALLQASSDDDNPDYHSAEIAINDICKLTPGIIKDVEYLHSCIDEKTLKETFEHLKATLDATREICSNCQKSDFKEMNDATSKFAKSSGKLIYTFNPRVNPKKEEQISLLSRAAVEQTSRMLSHIYQLAESIDNEYGHKLDDVGVKVVDVAQQLLKTAEVTAPSIANTRCKNALLEAIKRLSDQLRKMESTWKPLIKGPEHQQIGDQLNHDLNLIQIALDKLKDACHDHNGTDTITHPETQRLVFIATALKAKNAMIAAEKELKDKTPIKAIDKAEVPAMKRSLSQRLARLNSTIASLVLATADDDKPDYNAATRSIDTITRLTPDIIKDVKSIKGDIDQNSWKIVDENLNDVVVRTRDICRYVEDNNPPELKEAAFKCAKSVGRLSYVFGPPPDTKKENQILDLSRSAVEQTSLMLSDVQQLADKIGGNAGKKLNNNRVQVDKASKILQKTAEILAPTISDAYCQETLISAVDDLSKFSEELKGIWKPIVQAPQLRQTGDKLEENLKHVNSTLDKLRKACQKTDNSQVTKPTHINVQHAKDNIKEAENMFLVDKMVELPANECLDKPGATIKPITEQREQISHKIGALNEAMARLLQAMLDIKNPDNIQRIEKSIDVMSKLTPEIVKETIALQRNVDDDSRQILFEEAKALCMASQAVCDSVEKCNMEELNNAASQYAQTSRKLRYIISTRTYPNKEKKILDMSRSACERTSLMLSRVSRLAQYIEREKRIELDTSGAKVANAAQVLLNNAQITASSINEKNCQSALMSTVDTLTEHTQDLKEIWVPLTQQAEQKEIGDQLRRDLRLLLTELDKIKTTCQDDTEDAPLAVTHQVSSNAKPKPPDRDNIDNILEDIQKNVKEGKTPEYNKVTERLTIEDNPLRSLASKILDSVMAKSKLKSNNVSPNEQNELIAFSKELQAAIKSLDITNAKCRNDPLDPRKRQDLENAIMNLQQICLLSRRKNGEQNNIIDLADYIGDVTEAVDTISNVLGGIKREHGNDALMDIKESCERINDNARKVLNLEDEQLAEGNIIDDMLKIDQFAKDCENEVKRMNLAVPKINDEKARETLQNELQSLASCCDLLRFATKSSISSAKSATLDDGLQNLEDVEKKIEIILKPTEGDKVQMDEAISKPAIQAAQTALATSVASGNETELPKALARYAVQMRGIGAGHQKYRLKEHLKKLLDLLKTHAVVICRRVATWQEVQGPETTATTDKVLEELKSFTEEVEKSQNQKGSSGPVQIIRDSDVKNLLAPSESTVTGDQKHLNNKLQQQIQKLNSISGTIALSLHKPESLSRSLHTTSDAAQQLAAIARGIKNEDPVQNKRIEQAVQEMSIATYNLLKTSEASCNSSNPIDSRRRLLEACRLLNEAINKLGRAAFPADKLKNECGEMNRNLQLQQTFLQAESPTCALGYADCLDALNNQNDVIQKLRSEESIPRTDITTSLRYVTSSVCNSAEFAAQSAYLLSLSDADQSIAKHGVIDLARLYKVTEATEDTCLQIICAGPGEQAAELNGCLMKQVQQLQEAIDDASDKVKGDTKHPLIANSRELKSALNTLHGGVHLPTLKEEDFTLKIMKHLDTIKKINAIIKKVPQAKLDKDPKKTSMSTEVIDHTKSLLTSTSMMVKKASSSEENLVTWTMFGSSDVIKAFEALITCIREKGAEAGFIESLKSQEDQDVTPKSFVQKQVDLVNSWLRKPISKEKDKAAGVKAAEHVMALADQMCEDLTGPEKEEMKHMIGETKQLLDDCTVKYNSDKAYLLLERLKELRKMLEKGVVTRVVEDFLVDIPLDNLDTLQQETDTRKRKFLLQKKIAELLAQLGRVTKTARLVADTGTAPRHELSTTTEKVELLAPALVKAAQDRIESPNDKDSTKRYEDLLQQYAQSLANVRDLCDQAVDPIDFAQAAGETMHRIKEDSTVHSNDPQKSVYTSKVILKLGNRVVKAGMKSSLVLHDPELKETLARIDQTVTAKYDDVKKADWGDVMAEIMKKTSEVESALGGENIFLKQADSNQPIFAAALDLHAAVREWSARDNEIVAVAKRMAVLMARLSDYMNTENKRELLHTSKSIVSESREVAALAKKLALECTDMRIRTNLLQVCERIPTISGQLKMLTTVKGSSFGQGSKEDKEAMTMLVGNAQNLMTSIQEVVKAAASASVKIMSQRGCRMKWVRRNFY
ncbi:extracellular matrix-binding protein ebh-like isoform X2 [Maniola hyperantus]|uniref:extracellular matrix-binding protein ebh-like isoform X2 n=1 Tax=Aphantopus hyperantus TaxID=2795564 RepID=UPI00212DF11B